MKNLSKYLKLIRKEKMVFPLEEMHMKVAFPTERKSKSERMWKKMKKSIEDIKIQILAYTQTVVELQIHIRLRKKKAIEEPK